MAFARDAPMGPKQGVLLVKPCSDAQRTLPAGHQACQGEIGNAKPAKAEHGAPGRARPSGRIGQKRKVGLKANALDRPRWLRGQAAGSSSCRYRALLGISPLENVIRIGGWGDRQHLADRL